MRFFKDKEGRWAVVQFPNALISAWFILLVVNFFLHSQPLHYLQSAVLFAWAYMEMTEGESSFRKLLGAVVLIFVIINFFM